MNTMYNAETTLFNMKIETIRASYYHWHRREQERHPMHPAIIKAIQIAAPDDYKEIVMQWPYESDKQPGKLAFTYNPVHGRADRQTITTIGRYLRAQFPATLTDHQIRDICALETAKDNTFKFVTTVGGMLEALYRGPNSCMKCDDEAFAYAEDHPYRAYDPQYGWSMAVRYGAYNKVEGRALCNENKTTGAKIFVRSYKHNEESSSYSTTDEMLDAWLETQGYIKTSSWDGCRLAWVDSQDSNTDAGFVAPYIDGKVQTVREAADYLVICDDGDWKCDNTDGTATPHRGCECDHCGSAGHDEKDMASVGYNNDRSVCRHCLEYNYVYAYGRHGEEYYMPTDECTYVDSQDEWYVDRYMSDNDIVQTEDGDFHHSDDCVCIDNDWYHNESDEICYDYNDAPQLIENCTYDEDRGTWYHNDDLPEVVPA